MYTLMHVHHALMHVHINACTCTCVYYVYICTCMCDCFVQSGTFHYRGMVNALMLTYKTEGLRGTLVIVIQS